MIPLLTVLLLAQPAESFRRLTDDGAWCWIADPRAIAVGGRTIAGWVTSGGDVVVGSLDHETGEVRSRALHRRLDPDDHANPALIAQPDGRLLALYSKHADRVLRLRVSARPGDVTEWEPERELRLNNPDELRPGHPDLVCYPNPSRTGDALALFWRGTNWRPCLSFSRDGGVTWSLGRVAFSEPAAPRSNRPYLKSACDDGRRVHLVLTTGHPRDERWNSVSYCSYEDGVFRGADGRTIGRLADLPLAPSALDRVYDARTTGARAWIWDVAAARDGAPVIVYTRLPEETRHVYHYARWDGKRWTDHEIVEAGRWFPRTPPGKREREPHYSGGIALDHDDPSVVWLSRPVKGVFEIERWRTSDGGAGWEREPVTSGSQSDNVRPVAVRGAGRTVPSTPFGGRVLWMHLDRGYEHYTRFGCSIRVNLPEPPTLPAGRR